MHRSRRLHRTRSGAAAVEMAVVMNFVMLPMMIGLWEMGRLIQVQQIVSNSAREGSRLAAQAQTINQTGSPTQIVTSILPASNTADKPNIKAAVMQTLYGAGLKNLTWSDVDVVFVWIDQPNKPDGSAAPEGPSTSNPSPYNGIKNQRFQLTVTIKDFNKVRWVNLGLVNPDTVVSVVQWRILVDDPFTVNTTLPVWD